MADDALPQPERPLAARRLDALLSRIRDSLRNALDAFQSETFDGSLPLDKVLTVKTEHVNSVVSYLLDGGIAREEAQQLCQKWDRCWDESVHLQTLMRFPPILLNRYPASENDRDCPEFVRSERVNAERRVDHQKETDRQRGIVINAASALLSHVDDLISSVSDTAEENGKSRSKRKQPAKPKRRKVAPGKKAKRAERQSREKADKRLWEVWANGEGPYRTIADLAKAKGISKLDAQHALDRHRKRLERAGKWPPDKAGK